MRRWLDEISNKDYGNFYVRFDYVVTGTDQEKIVKMNLFKDGIINYFIEKNVLECDLIDTSAAASIDNIKSDAQNDVLNIIQETFNSSDNVSKEDNIKGLLGELICQWLIESYDAKPLYSSPTKLINSFEQGIDKWEFRKDEVDRIILRIWSSKCTSGRPSSRAVQIRKKDFKEIQIYAVLKQAEESIKNNGSLNFNIQDIKDIKLSLLKKDSRLSLGVVMVFDFNTYVRMYCQRQGEKLNVFTQPLAKYSKNIIRFVPIDKIDTFIREFEPNVYKKLGKE